MVYDEPPCWRAKCDSEAKMLSLQSFLRKGVSLRYVGRNYNLKDLKDITIRKDAGLCCGSRLRSGEVFAYVGRNQNLKDLEEPPTIPLHEPLHGELNAIRKQECFLCSPFYGRACRWAMLGEIKT